MRWPRRSGPGRRSTHSAGRAERRDPAPKRWIEVTGAIGIRSKADRAGSTSTYKDIACELGSRGSIEFKRCHTSRTIAR